MKKSKENKNIKKWKRKIKIIKIITKIFGLIIPVLVLGGIKAILSKIND